MLQNGRQMTSLTKYLHTILGLLMLTTIRPVRSQQFFAYFITLLGAPCNQDPDAERCGSGFIMRTGTDGTIDCSEKCAYIPFLNVGFTCGSCSPVPSNAPVTPTPIAPTPIAPTPPTAPIIATTPAPAQPSGNFEITMDLVGSTSVLTSTDLEQFTNSINRWQNIITSDVSDIQSSTLPVAPKFSGCQYPVIIDDMYLCIRVAADDGEGGTLGYASPSYQRPSNGLTVSGYINLDVADVKKLINAGTFDDVFMHEIGHILGIGTYFFENGVAGPNSQRCPYFGEKATAEYKKISNCDVVPLENSGKNGDGTFCSHWDEECLTNELMTGIINYGGPNPLSRISIASLEDLGYTVDYTTADPFTAANVGTGCSCRRRHLKGVTNSDTSLHPFTTMYNKRNKQRRTLSDETRQYAIEQGLKFFKENPDDIPSGSLFNKTKAEAIYVGNQMVSVLVQDGVDGDIYGVQVLNPDYYT